MPRTQTRRSLSVARKTYDDFRAHCESKRLSMSSVLEGLILKFLEPAAKPVKPRCSRVSRWDKTQEVAAVITPPGTAEILPAPARPKSAVQALRDARPSEALEQAVKFATVIDVQHVESTGQLPTRIKIPEARAEEIVRDIRSNTMPVIFESRLPGGRARGSITTVPIAPPSIPKTLPEVLAIRETKLFDSRSIPDKNLCAWCGNTVRSRYVDDPKTGERFHKTCADEMSALNTKTGSSKTR